MTYLIVQLQLFLLLAFLLGALLGWWFRHFAARRLEESLRADIAERNSRMGHIENERLELKLLADERQAERDGARAEVQSLNEQLDENRLRIEESSTEIDGLKERLQADEQCIAELKEAADNQRSLEQQLREESDGLQDELESVREQLRQQEESGQVLQDQLELEQGRTEKQSDELLAASDRDASYHFQINNRDKELRRLTALLESQTAKTASALAARDQLLAKGEAANSEQSAADEERLQSASLALEACRNECVALQTQLKDCEQRFSALENSVQLDGEESIGLEAEAIAAAEAKMFAEPPEQIDDLKLISGVGPKLEAMLNKLGIYQFAQVASFSADDVRWVDYHLTAFKGRISRDDWVGQAAELLQKADTNDG
jgi:predicted flap endonuclease-1-like 5' DNA nuclease